MRGRGEEGRERGGWEEGFSTAARNCVKELTLFCTLLSPLHLSSTHPASDVFGSVPRENRLGDRDPPPAAGRSEGRESKLRRSQP